MARKSVRRWLGAALLAVGVVFTTAAPAAAVPAWNLISGQELRHASGARCTLGFNAYAGDARVILTAGQCTSLGGSWFGVGGYIGESAGSSFPGNDYGLISVQSTDALSTPLVDRYSAGSDVTIIGVANPTVGMSVCYSSPLSGWVCGGTVTAVNQTVCYPQGCVTGLTRTSLCPAPGSGGAPVVTNPGAGTTVRAVGLLTGGSGSCTRTGTSWLQPIAEPLAAYGLTLYTG